MTKFFLIWFVVLLLIAVVSHHLLTRAENQCQEKCAATGKTYQYTVPRGSRRARRPARCICRE